MAGLGTTMLANVLALTLLAPPLAALAPPLLEDKTAQRKLDAGLEEFYAEDFEAAAALFAEAYALEPQPFLLYSWAQAERYANNCPKAVELFERFLRTQPPQEEAQRARQKIVECGGIPPRKEDLLAPDVPPAPEASQQDAKRSQPLTASTVPPPPNVDEPAPTREDRTGRVLLFTGLGIALAGGATGATGGILVAGGERIREQAPDIGDHEAFAAELDRGAARKRTGVIVAAVGGGTLVVGTALLVTAIVLRRKGRASALRPSPRGLVFRF